MKRRSVSNVTLYLFWHLPWSGHKQLHAVAYNRITWWKIGVYTEQCQVVWFGRRINICVLRKVSYLDPTSIWNIRAAKLTVGWQLTGNDWLLLSLSHPSNDDEDSMREMPQHVLLFSFDEATLSHTGVMSDLFSRSRCYHVAITTQPARPKVDILVRLMN